MDCTVRINKSEENVLIEKKSVGSNADPMMPSCVVSKPSIISVVLDLLVITGALSALFLIKYSAPVHEVGFFCSDTSIRLPYLPSTIPSWANVSLSYGITFLLVFLLRVVLKQGTIWDIWAEIKTFFMGGVLTQLMNNTTKVLTGRLRPHFLAVCNPQYLPECGFESSLTYVSNVTCSGNQDLFVDGGEMEHRLREARISFPSGHASLSWYGMVFAALYIQFKCHRRGNRLSLPFLTLQGMFLTYSLIVCITRVTDNKHHATDVVAGGILGTVMAVLSFSYCVNKTENMELHYRKSERRSTDHAMNNNSQITSHTSD